MYMTIIGKVYTTYTRNKIKVTNFTYIKYVTYKCMLCSHLCYYGFYT